MSKKRDWKKKISILAQNMQQYVFFVRNIIVLSRIQPFRRMRTISIRLRIMTIRSLYLHGIRIYYMLRLVVWALQIVTKLRKRARDERAHCIERYFICAF